MIEKICTYIVNQMRKQMPDIDDEKAEIITYGIELIIGEIPKIFLLFVLSFILGIGWYTVFAYVALIPYRASSGGFHLKTHIGCIIYTLILYSGSALLGKYIILTGIAKYIIAFVFWTFCMIMLKLYAPADTENVPILRKKERRQKKIISYIILTVEFIIAVVINNSIIAGVIIFGDFIQTLTITRLAYKITDNKYGHEIYANA